MLKLSIVLLFCLGVHDLIAQFKMVDLEKVQEFKNNEAYSAVLLKSETLFLEKLNDYRKSKKVKSLEDKTPLSIMALNHTIWMRHHKKLSHDQKKNSKFFSGSSLMKRLEFVDEKFTVGMIAENIAYFHLSSLQSEKEEELADLIATKFLELWKSSLPHRQNMLEKSFEFSGVSFLVIGDKIYGTQVFANG